MLETNCPLKYKKESAEIHYEFQPIKNLNSTILFLQNHSGKNSFILTEYANSVRTFY